MLKVVTFRSEAGMYIRRYIQKKMYLNTSRIHIYICILLFFSRNRSIYISIRILSKKLEKIHSLLKFKIEF